MIVRALPGHAGDAYAAVRQQGGTIERELPMIDGVEARVPAGADDALRQSPGVAAVTTNDAIQFEAMSYDDGATASNFVKTTNAAGVWKAGTHGEGIGVAVIDTGISEMNDFRGRVVYGPDLSGEGTIVDTFGHGTAMAGVIAGSGDDSATRSGGAYTGIAPKATLVAVKVAGRNGATDVSTMLQAMHFVSSYKDQFNIKVLNLSWGTKSRQDPAVDPLNYAVERLWRQGIVVVVAAGNSGNDASTITKPGDDPVVLTVGAYNDQQNTSPTDDDVPAWSSRGPTATGLTKPDVVAPGRRIPSARSYGSFVEQDNSQALISPSYIRGSGTSQAAAVVSGAAALLLQSRPNLTPDQVKAVFKGTASPMLNVAATIQGAGRIDVGRAVSASAGPAQWQTFQSNGLGSIEASRGDAHVQTDCGNDGTVDVIQGEIDTHCEAWNGSTWTGSTWTGSTWTGSTWTGSTWTGSTWTGSTWTGSTWTGSTWTGSTWTGSTWTGGTWTGSSWYGSTWTGSTWTGSTWTGSTWTGSTWTGSTWTGSTWTGSTWTGSQFVSLFWGDCPKAGLKIVGELSADVLALLGLPCK